MAWLILMIVKRGEIYRVKFNPTRGSEIRKIRPALIIQNDTGNEFSPLTIVAPISSIKKHTKKYPTDVWITPGESGLACDSRVLLSQIRTVDKDERLLNKIGKLSSKKMMEVDQAIRISLALD